jgi:hypothetical protein
LQVKAQLERKLWTLWGNLEELKSSSEWTLETGEKPANHPFECCVDEFGIELENGQYQRMHKIKQTVIRE